MRHHASPIADKTPNEAFIFPKATFKFVVSRGSSVSFLYVCFNGLFSYLPLDVFVALDLFGEGDDPSHFSVVHVWQISCGEAG